jgi:hypothetical protein
VHADSQRFGKNRCSVVDLVGYKEELALMSYEALPPTTWKVSVVSDGHPGTDRPFFHLKGAFLTGLLTGGGPAGGAGGALVVLVATDRTGNGGFQYDPLPDLNTRNRRTDLLHDCQHFMPQHRRKGAEGFHYGAGGISDVPDVRAANPSQNRFQPDPFGTGKDRMRNILKAETAQPPIGDG